MKHIIHMSLISLMFITGCGDDGSNAPMAGSTDGTPVVVSPPSAPPPNQPPGNPNNPPVNCPLNKSWNTNTVPSSALNPTTSNETLGYESQPNNPVYILDLTSLVNGNNFNFPLKHDQTHVCLYNINVDLSNNTYTLQNFQGCNPGVIPPGGNVNNQCSYCYGAGFSNSVVPMNWTFTYQLSCNALTITDTNSGQQISYY